jgi:hypothetical protein
LIFNNNEEGEFMPNYQNLTNTKLLSPLFAKENRLPGGDNTERAPYFIKGRLEGTSRGKVYKKN